MSFDEKAFREQQERLMAENVKLKEQVMGLQELGEYKSHKIDKLASIARSWEQKLDAANLQIEAMRSALQKIVDHTHVDTCINPGFQPCDCLENIAKGGLSLKRACEHVWVNYQCEKCGKGDPQKGVGNRMDDDKKMGRGSSALVILAFGILAAMLALFEGCWHSVAH